MEVIAETTGLTSSPPRRPPLTPVLFGLAEVTGIVDAVCYLGLGHVFTANMTGNVVLLGFAVAGVESLSVSRSMTALAAFLLGPVLGVRLARSIDPSIQRWPAAAFACEAALLLMSASVAGSLSVGASAASTRVYAVIVSTGVAMGMRNATIRRLGEREVNTTVLTMTLTAIGSDSVFAGGSNQGALRRFGFVMSVLAGAAVGALLLRFSASLTLGIAGAASSICAAAAYLDTRRSRSFTASTSRMSGCRTSSSTRRGRTCLKTPSSRWWSFHPRRRINTGWICSTNGRRWKVRFSIV